MAIDPQTILSQSQAYANALKSDLDAALDRLESYATGLGTWVDFPESIYPEPTKTQPIDPGTLPSLEKTVFGNDLTDPIAEIEKYKKHTFIAPYLDLIQAKLWEWVQTSGTGIDDEVQEALWNNQRERDLQTLHDGLDAVAAVDAKRGFQYSTARRKTSEVIVNHMMTRDNRNREITALIADLAQKNVHFAITQNIAVEQLHSGFALGLSGIFNTTKNHIIEKYRLEMTARIAEHDAKMKAILAGYDLAKANAGLDANHQELLARTAGNNLAIHTERTRTLIQQAEAKEARRLQAMAGYVSGLSAQLSAALLQTNGIAVTTSKA